MVVAVCGRFLACGRRMPLVDNQPIVNDVRGKQFGSFSLLTVAQANEQERERETKTTNTKLITKRWETNVQTFNSLMY